MKNMCFAAAKQRAPGWRDFAVVLLAAPKNRDIVSTPLTIDK